MGRWRSRLDRLQRRLSPQQQVKVEFWWACRDHPGRITPALIELSDEEEAAWRQAIEAAGGHLCIEPPPDIIKLRWADQTAP